MEKQHNRGQDGAGIATVKLDIEAGNPFLYRLRSSAQQPIADLFYKVGQEIQELEKFQSDITKHPGLMKGHLPFMGELLLGHLRYGTQGKNNVEFCHPFIKRNISPGKNLALAGNFNLVNTDDLFAQINFEPGAFQKQSDLAAMMEVVHHFLVKEDEINPNNPSVANVLKKATPLFDGGYTIGGLLGNGSSFIMRDAHGIRPAYYYISDDVIVAASERAAIRTTFNVGENEVKELMPGQALIVDVDGNYKIEQVLEAKERKACSFERIYFSRGSDAEIYRERKMLGKLILPAVLEAIESDTDNTVFSYIPNTAETSFYGMVEAAQDFLNQRKNKYILTNRKTLTKEKLEEILSVKIRTEKVAIKDAKLRTFITEDSSRDDLVAHVYDVTYGVIKPEDNLVIIDDSIVRGTTLKKSIIRMMDRLNPKRIVIVSSAPQIRYPDCYGIDMAKLEGLVAFRAVLELLKESNQYSIIDEVYKKCKLQEKFKDGEIVNYVKEIYAPFTDQQVSDKIAEMLCSSDTKAEVKIIFQSVDNLHIACPKNLGDWYFTGDYPTPGGNRVVNRAFMNFYEGKDARAY